MTYLEKHNILHTTSRFNVACISVAEWVDAEKIQRIIHGAQRIRMSTVSCEVQILTRDSAIETSRSKGVRGKKTKFIMA